MGALKTLATSIHQAIAKGPVVGSFVIGEPALTIGVPLFVGAEHLDQHHAVPHVVWVAAREIHTRKDAPTGPMTMPDGTIGQPFVARKFRVDVHIFETDSEAADDFVDALLAAAATVIGARALRFVGASWPNEARPELIQHGVKVIVTLELHHPVNKQTWTTATVESVPMPLSQYVASIS